MEKTKDTNPKTTQVFKLSDKNFRAAIIKMLPEAIKNTLETNGKLEGLSKATEDRRTRKNFRTKNYNRIFKTQWIGSVAK